MKHWWKKRDWHYRAWWGIVMVGGLVVIAGTAMVVNAMRGF